MTLKFLLPPTQAFLLSFLVAALIIVDTAAAEPEQERPNIVFISIDDLNDWNSVYGGYPGVETPNLDRLAGNSVTFLRSYCASPRCNPSRVAVMFGKRASTTGVYNNQQFMGDSPVIRESTSLPAYFKKNGYGTYGAGKLYHWVNGPISEPEAWTEQGGINFRSSRPSEFKGGPVPNIKYGPTDVPESEMMEVEVAHWAAEHISRDHDKPFFIAAGIFRPHLPWFVPQKYFDLYPLEEIQLPLVNPADLEDIPPIGREIAMSGMFGPFTEVLKHGKWRETVQAYLASISYADACLGIILDAIENSPHADNTIIVLWSDHGWNLGEKLSFSKWKLWEESIRTPLMVHVPGNSVQGTASERVVSLLDIYPTLIELTGLPPIDDLDGQSFVPLLEDPDTEWDLPAIVNREKGQYAIRSERYNYIRYEDGSEELYDHRHDPLEWTNLAEDPLYAPIKEKLKQHIPSVEHPSIAEDFKSHL